MKFNPILTDNACSLLVSQTLALHAEQPDPSLHSAATYLHVKGGDAWQVSVTKMAKQEQLAA
jgi:hypothetical protein